MHLFRKTHELISNSEAGTTEARFARRQCIIGKVQLNSFPVESEPQQSGAYLMLKDETLPNWKMEADYSECSVSSSTSEAFSRQQHGSVEFQAQTQKPPDRGEFDPTDKWVSLGGLFT